MTSLNLPSKVLLVDDDPEVLEALKDLFSEDYFPLTASSGPNSIEVARENSDITTVVMDIKMAQMDGITAAREIRKLIPDIPIIFHTGYPGDYNEDDIENNEQPFDYIQKGESLSRLMRSVHNAVVSQKLRTNHHTPGASDYETYGLVGTSRAIQEIRMMITQATLTNQKIMVLGETGTGKEIVAKAIHRNSLRRNERLGILNCNHKSPDLIESELFGHTKGSFTGAWEDRIGLFEYSHKGSVFLDEIGDLDPTTQAKLLRVIENGEYQRIGSPELRQVDVRIICATHRNLEDMVENGDFREDLYYRLKGAAIRIPPLRDRREDIPALVKHFVNMTNETYQSPPRILEESALDALINYDWPGNVRQLEDTVESLLLLSSSDVVFADEVEDYLQIRTIEDSLDEPGLRTQLLEFERMTIIKTLAKADNNISEASRILRMDRASLSKKIKAHGINLGN